jgi:hypothetical protein
LPPSGVVANERITNYESRITGRGAARFAVGNNTNGILREEDFPHLAEELVIQRHT